MKKYPDALSTPTTATHIKAAEDNLNSARRAQREINIQKSSKILPQFQSIQYIRANRCLFQKSTEIAGMKDIEAKKAAAAKK